MPQGLSRSRRSASPKRHAAPAALAAAWVALACAQGPAPAKPAATPEHQLIVEGLRLEARRGGRVVWDGTAARGAGDLNVADVQGLRLMRRTAHAGQLELSFTAQNGHLAFETGQATLRGVQVHEPGGGTLRCDEALYDEPAGRVDVPGKVTYEAPGLQAEAASGLVDIESGVVHFAGPVTGQARRAPPAPLPP